MREVLVASVLAGTLRFLESDLKRDAILQVDSTPDFIASCADQGRALIASH